ncbi:MAG: hypothetical protein KAS32_26805 [Candidatus Peribacteraceae bacterium]|nr:hypothetical protein [Candidatus Peribacteraceae bacterium]
MWDCKKCEKQSEKLQVCWGISGGEKVDLIDFFCPHCASYKVVFKGTDDERQAYWDMEWSS